MFHKLKSSEPDFSLIQQSKFLDIMNGNILYLTREVDLIARLVKQLAVNKDLQHQVDKFFDDETSPQTDQAQE